MLLPDTSVWVAYLRAGSESITRELSAALERREVVVCGPVVAELIAGARPHDRPTLLGSLGGLRWAGLDRLAWQSVGLLAAELRDRGEVLPLTDVEIAVAAHSARAVLWTADPHFERLAALLDGLELRPVVSRAARAAPLARATRPDALSRVIHARRTVAARSPVTLAPDIDDRARPSGDADQGAINGTRRTGTRKPGER